MKVRRKHTAYLTEELVRALDRSYYERRLTEPISKQDFFEELLWRGLRLRGSSPFSAPATTAGQAAPPLAPPTPARARSCEAAAPDACLLSGAPARDRPGPSARTGGTRPPQPHPERRRPTLHYYY